jgi:hypothetical protein
MRGDSPAQPPQWPCIAFYLRAQTVKFDSRQSRFLAFGLLFTDGHFDSECVMLSAAVRHRFESLRVKNDAGRFDVFRKVTKIGPCELSVTLSTETGESVITRGDGIFETLSGARWRLAE